VRHAAPEISLISFELSMLPQLVRVMNGAACIDRDAGPNAMATAATIGISLNLVFAWSALSANRLSWLRALRGRLYPLDNGGPNRALPFEFNDGAAASGWRCRRVRLSNNETIGLR
jgi:hypothetical protein